MTDKELVKARRNSIVESISPFCREFLDEEYEDLCVRLADKMARKRAVPFVSGQIPIWAGSVVYAIGQINFLFDPSSMPHVAPDDICDYFGVKKTTISNKAKAIRDMFKLSYFDREFSTAAIAEKDPFKDLVVVDGFIVPKSSLPLDLLKMLKY